MDVRQATRYLAGHSAAKYRKLDSKVAKEIFETVRSSVKNIKSWADGVVFGDEKRKVKRIAEKASKVQSAWWDVYSAVLLNEKRMRQIKGAHTRQAESRDLDKDLVDEAFSALVDGLNGLQAFEPDDLVMDKDLHTQLLQDVINILYTWIDIMYDMGMEPKIPKA